LKVRLDALLCLLLQDLVGNVHQCLEFSLSCVNSALIFASFAANSAMGKDSFQSYSLSAANASAQYIAK
jgi:hypothetical protein